MVASVSMVQIIFFAETIVVMMATKFPIKLSDRKIMTVYSDSPQYLRGNIKHKYNGEYWESVEGELEDYKSKEVFRDLSKFEKKFL